MNTSGDETRDRADIEGRLADLTRELERSNETDSKSLLDEIASLAAAGSSPAMVVLLRETLDRRLAERPVNKILLNPADVDDAVQTTLIAVAENISSFEGRARYTTWLGTIARNEALMVLRRRQRKSEPTGELPEIDPRTRRVSSIVVGQQAYDAAFAELSPEHQQVLTLRDTQKLTYEEIAATIGIPVNTVRSRLSRARVSLFDRLYPDQPK